MRRKRRSCFLYNFLNGKALNENKILQGNPIHSSQKRSLFLKLAEKYEPWQIE